MGGEVAERELAGAGDLGRVADPGGDLGGRPVADAGQVEVAQVADQRHRPHGRDHGLPDRGVQRSLQPPRQGLPGHSGLRQPLGPARSGHQGVAVLDRDGRQRLVRGEQWLAGGRYGVVRPVPAVEGVPEQCPLPRPVGRRCGMGQLQDVAEAVALEGVSYLSSARPVYSRRTASAIPRLTGWGSRRPYRAVQ